MVVEFDDWRGTSAIAQARKSEENMPKGTPQIPCPCCYGKMESVNVVCWVCYFSTNCLAPASVAQRLGCTLESALRYIDVWNWLRDRRFAES